MVRKQKSEDGANGEPQPVGTAIAEVLDHVQNAQGLAEGEVAPPQNGNAEKHAERVKLPDPYGIHTIALTEEKDGPKMRLARNHRYRRMEMSFDENPGADVLTALKDAGWKWERQEQAWTLNIDPKARYVDHLAAEKLFQDIANTIRETNGLPAIIGMNVGA